MHGTTMYAHFLHVNKHLHDRSFQHTNMLPKHMVLCQGCVCDSCLVCNLGRGGAMVCLLCLYLYNYFITLHDCVAATGRKCTLF